MKRLRIPSRFVVLSFVLVGLNLGAWLWLRQELLHQKNAPVASTGPRPVQLLSIHPREKAETAERLTLVFDQPVRDEKDLGPVKDAPPFQVTPAVPGRWEWTQPNRLDYVLDDPLKGGRTYQVQPIPDTEISLGREVVFATPAKFETSPLELLSCEVTATDKEHVTLTFKFSQAVSPDDLLEHLLISEEPSTPKQPVRELKALTKKPSETIVVQCRQTEIAQLRVTLARDLKGHDGEKSLEKEIERTVSVPRFFSWLRTNVAITNDLENLSGSTVSVVFSQELDPQQKFTNVELQPAVPDLVIDVASYSRNKLRLQGRFEPGKTYQLTIGENLLSEEGKTLGSKVKTKVTIPELEPEIQFAGNEGILSPSGHLELDVVTVNVNRLRLSASRIHANNLVTYLHDRDTWRTGREVVDKTITLPNPTGHPQKHVLELTPVLGKEPLGLFEIEARALDERWTRDFNRLTITDIGLIAKQHKEGLLVWTASLNSAQPLEGVTVSAVTQNNQVLAKGITGADGILKLDIPRNHPDGSPWVLIAEKGADLTYLEVEESHWQPDSVEVSGRPTPETYDIHLYSERGVYRPGDTLYLTGIVRDAQGQVPPAFPLSVTITRPDGRVAATLPVQCKTETPGVFQFDFPTRVDDQTGPYRFTVSIPGSTETLGKTTALVEAFVPARMEATIDSTDTLFGPQDKPTFTIRGRYLFGQPAADIPLNIVAYFRQTNYSSKKFPEFVFQYVGDANSIPILQEELKLDADGKYQLEVAPPKDTQPGFYTGTISATLTEPGGRSLSQRVSCSWDLAEKHLGMKLKTGNLARAGEESEMELACVTWKDEPTNPGTLKLKLLKVDYSHVWRHNNHFSHWEYERRTKEIWTGTLAADQFQEGLANTKVKCPLAGEYQLIAHDEGDTPLASLTFQATTDSTATNTYAWEKPDELELLLDQERYLTGSTAKVVVRSPFPGRLLLTVESNRVWEHRVIEMAENTQTLEVKIPAEIRGDAFINASVVRPLQKEATQWMPHRARGLVRVKTDHAAHQVAVTLESPEKIRPEDSLPVKVQAKLPPGQSGLVHLWAVDEGILLTTAYKTPAPFQHFWGPRAWGVQCYDRYGDLLADYLRATDISRIGGDRGDGEPSDSPMDDSNRRSLMPAKKSTAVVVWNEVRPLNPNGEADFTLPTPRFTGELRVMAVVMAGDHYGSAQRSVTVTAPLLVEASWPRFAAPGDKLKVPVKLFNTTSESLSPSLSLKASGPLQITLPEEASHLTIEAGKNATVWLAAEAQGLGTAQIAIEAQAETPQLGKLTASAITDLPVRPATHLETLVQTKTINVGDSLEIPVEPGFIPATLRRTVRIDKNNPIDLLPAIDSLIEYPYGCVEQTSSRIWAGLAAEEVLKQYPEDGRQHILKEMIAAGISRLWNMQASSGGLRYWPGEGAATPWGSAYAARILLQAKKKGHAVDEEFLSDLLDYLAEQLSRTDSDDHNSGTQATIVRVLAEGGKPPEGWLVRLTEQVAELDMAARADLAAGWLAAGRKDKALQVLPEDTLQMLGANSFQERFSLPTQQYATLLSVLADIDPQHPWIPNLKAKILEARQKSAWYTTLENATVIHALAKVRPAMDIPVNYTGELDAGLLGKHVLNHEKPQILEFRGEQTPLKLQTQGSGEITITTTTTGLLEKPDLKDVSQGLILKRGWYMESAGKNGTERKEIDPANVRVGDLIHVELRLKCPNGDVPNVAIVDALPACMEVENPRLATSDQAGETPNADHVEFLDDRVLLFTTARASEQVFRYALRVTTQGEFVIPAIEASGMYDPGLRAVTGAGQITIRE